MRTVFRLLLSVIKPTFTINAILHESTAKLSDRIDFCRASVAIMAAHHKSLVSFRLEGDSVEYRDLSVCYDENNAIILPKTYVHSLSKKKILRPFYHVS